MLSIVFMERFVNRNISRSACNGLFRNTNIDIFNLF